jgi:dihydrofolate reductase
MEWFGRGPCSSRPVHVFASRHLPITETNVTLTDAPPERFVAELSEQGITAAGLMSGPSLLASFRSAGLVTGYFLGIVPVVLGRGLRLFDPPGSRENLRLIDLERWPNGVVQLRHHAIGA